ncbi:hypothetical protein PL373_16205 [Tenacibaculum maritimum]|nr:hypothetical protein [Tenacibaculum maritimum]MDB0602645.1 hypothetical protein [Tenacibaculum maritimum]MDB0611244.1 hypothetical protein [Tenacibaculum maritimum]
MKDLLLDENGDLSIVNGDFIIGNSSEQSVEQLLISKAGEWKEHPQIGCDIQKSMNGLINRFLERNIRVQLEADGFNIEKLKVTESGLELKGDYD